MTTNGEVQFCMDTLLVEAVLADPQLYKRADLKSSIEQYFSSKVDKEHPVESVFNELIAPGLMIKLFGWKWGLLAGILTSVFHINVGGMLASLVGKVRDLVGDGKRPITQAQVNSAVQEVAQEHSETPSSQEASEGYKALQHYQTSKADDGKYSSLELLHDAKMLRLAMMDREFENMRLLKEPLQKRADLTSFLKDYGGAKAKKTSLLARILGWVVSIALISAGVMVVGDVINLGLGRPSSLSSTNPYQAGEEPTRPPAPTTTQTKFKFKSDAPLQGSWPLTNTPENVGNMLIQFAKDVYNGLDGKEDLIQSSPDFQNTKEKINWYNIHNPGSAVIFLPKFFASKKQIVDTFIDDVAARST